jgi:putative PIN family toxin of toxin-antitoxin system
MRVVIDPNVFVSSFFGGNPRRIIDFWKEGRVTLCLSKGIVDEYIEVLQRLGTNVEELADILGLFKSGIGCLFTATTPDLTIVECDPEDDKFIECAVALGAEYIVSGDQDLIQVQDYMGMQTLTPAQFLEQLSE